MTATITLPFSFPPNSLPGRLTADACTFLGMESLRPLRELGFLAACSGGPDSCALLWAAAHAAAVLGFRLEAATVDHGIRPKSADDAAFVQELCRRLAIPCHHTRLVMPPHASENELRDARYDFFNRCIHSRRLGGVLLGHTAEDQAETVLLHLIRGTGLRGLGAMQPVDGVRIRPFLEWRKDDLRNFLRQIGETWREDETNSQPAYLRNRVRHDILSRLQQENPRIVESLCQTARLARLEHRAVVEMAQRRLARRHAVFPGFLEMLPLGEWMQDPPGVRMIALRRWWRFLAPPETELRAALVEEAHDAAAAGNEGAWTLPGPVHLSVDHGFFVMGRPMDTAACTFFAPDGTPDSGRAQETDFRLVPDAQGDIPLDPTAFPLTLRRIAPGDRLVTARGTWRCKKLLERVPRGLRPYTLVLADAQGRVRWMMFAPQSVFPADAARFHLEWKGFAVDARFPFPAGPENPPGTPHHCNETFLYRDSGDAGT